MNKAVPSVSFLNSGNGKDSILFHTICCLKFYDRMLCIERRVDVPTDFDTIEKALSRANAAEKGLK